MTSHRTRVSVFVASLLALAGCSGAQQDVGGTFAGMAITPLPSPPLPRADLEIDATLRLDAAASTFELDMDLAAAGLTDVMNVRGTYVAANGMLTLTPTGYEVDPASGNVVSSPAPGVHCIALLGFAETPVCLGEHTHPYVEEAGELAFTLDHQIAGVDGSTTMSLPRVP